MAKRYRLGKTTQRTAQIYARVSPEFKQLLKLIQRTAWSRKSESDILTEAVKEYALKHVPLRNGLTIDTLMLTINKVE